MGVAHFEKLMKQMMQIAILVWQEKKIWIGGVAFILKKSLKHIGHTKKKSDFEKCFYILVQSTSCARVGKKNDPTLVHPSPLMKGIVGTQCHFH